MEPQTTPSLPRNPPVALTIAGYDPSSGAGITADLLVFQAHGLFGVSAITALTVQSTRGVTAVKPLPEAWISDTLNTLDSDLPPRGIKIGMLGSREGVLAVAAYLTDRCLGTGPKASIPIVLDPVLRSSSGTTLLPNSALEALRERLLPQVAWITPNWSELALLSGREVDSLDQAEAAAGHLAQSYPSLGLIVTGGDQTTPTDLLRLPGGQIHPLPGTHIETTSTHGTGCAFSTSFLANLILQQPPFEAARSAKQYVAEALRRAPALGHGRGPLNLLWPLR